MIHIILVIVIVAASILCMLARPRGTPEAYWACGGALLLVFSRLLPVRQAAQAVLKGTDVYLFLIGMMALAELAREGGVFDWVADIAAHHSRRSSARLFLLIYLAGTVTTVLLSNDATAVVLTPAVLAVVRKAKVAANPYVLACAFIANAASFVLPISNPANLVIFGKNMPELTQWLRIFLLPSLASVVVTFVVLRFTYRQDLKSTIQFMEMPRTLSTQGKLALAGLVLACLGLIGASFTGADLGAPTCGAGLFVLFLVTLRNRRAPIQVAKSISWSVVPLVAGLFVMMQALQNAGMLRLGIAALQNLAHLPRMVGNLGTAFGVGLLSNAMNNLPVGLISGAAAQAAHQTTGLTHSVLIGVDLGPNLSVTGSLATILWLIELRREQVEITAWQFLKVGIIAMPLALFAGILLLST